MDMSSRDAWHHLQRHTLIFVLPCFFDKASVGTTSGGIEPLGHKSISNVLHKMWEIGKKEQMARRDGGMWSLALHPLGCSFKKKKKKR